MSRDKSIVLGRGCCGWNCLWGPGSPWLLSLTRSVCRERYFCRQPQNRLQPGWSLTQQLACCHAVEKTLGCWHYRASQETKRKIPVIRAQDHPNFSLKENYLFKTFQRDSRCGCTIGQLLKVGFLPQNIRNPPPLKSQTLLLCGLGAWSHWHSGHGGSHWISWHGRQMLFTVNTFKHGEKKTWYLPNRFRVCLFFHSSFKTLFVLLVIQKWSLFPCLMATHFRDKNAVFPQTEITCRFPCKKKNK